MNDRDQRLRDKVELWKQRCAQRDEQLESIHNQLGEVRDFLLRDSMGLYGSRHGDRGKDRERSLEVVNNLANRWYRHHYHGDSTTRLQERIAEQRREIRRLLEVICGE